MSSASVTGGGRTTGTTIHKCMNITDRTRALDDVPAVVAFARHQSEPFACVLVFAQFRLEALLLLRFIAGRRLSLVPR